MTKIYVFRCSVVFR